MRTVLICSAVLGLTIAAAPSTARAQQDAPYCLIGNEAGGPACSYNTMAQCEQSREPMDVCTTNPRYKAKGTRGSSDEGRAKRPRSKKRE